MFKLSTKFKLLITAALFLGCPFFVSAACSTNTNLDFIARDPSGGFVSNVRVEVYRQELDANGKPKPTTRLASATTDANLGIARLSFRGSEESGTYALKVQSVTKDSASFWFYNNTLACGASATLEKKLSGIAFTLRDADGNLLRNTSFNVYSQLYDTGGKPLKERRELIATLNTGYSGQAKIYLPQGSVRSLDNTLNDHYALEISRPNAKFYFYNIAVLDNTLTVLDYYLSSLRVRLQDATGAPFPNGTAVEVYNQDIDADNSTVKGAKVGNFTIGDNGYGNFEIGAGIYALAVKGKNGQYQNFWDVEAEDGRMTEYTLTPDSAWTPTEGSCQNNSNLTVVLRSYSGKTVSGLKFEVYEQNTDAYGIPIAGKRIGGGTFDNSGRYVLTFKPDPRKTYALKVWDKRADRGEFWFFDSTRFVCGYDRAITKTLPILEVILRDAQGALKRNYNFSLYMQEYDADNNPVLENSNLIANLKTDNTGAASAYVASYNTYVPGQTGFYAVSLKDSNGNTENFYNLRASADKDYVFESLLSGLSGELRDARSNILANKNLNLYEQKSTSGTLALGQKLLSFKTDSSGKYQFEYPAGTYAIVSLDSFNRNNIFWNIKIGQSNNYQKLTASLINFNLNGSQTQSVGNDSASLQLYALTGNRGSYSRGAQIGTIKLINNKAEMTLAPGTYLATYTGLGNLSYGQPFYAKNGSAYTVNINVSSKYIITEKSSFQLPGAESLGSSSNSATSNSSTNSSAGPLSSQVKGKILLQVQDKGQAWYVNPVNGKRYSLGRPQDAFNVMRRLALGVSNPDFSAIENNTSAWKNLAGRILLKTQDNGRAYYFDPVDLKLYYLGRPQDAFNVMRNRGLGITTSDLTKISVGD